MPFRKPFDEDSPRAMILLVDDNSNGLKARKSVLEEHGHSVVMACGGEDALERFGREKFDLVVTDYKMPGMDGVELISRLRQLRSALPVILLSGFADTLGLTPETTGADAVIQKSAHEVAHLVRAVAKIAQQRFVRKPPTPQGSLPPRAKRKGGAA
jgi:CheY-like chemotaxis protein